MSTLLRVVAIAAAFAGVASVCLIASAEDLYQTVSPGPFIGPVADLGLAAKAVPYDLDPAEGLMEDFSGWYGTVAEEGHTFDGNKHTWFLVADQSEVMASADGVVVDLNDGVPVGDPNAANYVWMEHDGEWASTYWDLAPGVTDYVELDDELEQEDILGLSSGVEDDLGPHLTFGTYYHGEAGCPFHEGYWHRGLEFFHGILQYQEGDLWADADTSSEVVGHQVNSYAYCSTGNNRDGYYRYWHPTEWGTVVQALDQHAQLENAEDYLESGTWESSAGGARADHVLGYATRGTEGEGSATFVPRFLLQREYEVFAAWGAAANAADVTYRIAHADGEDTVTLSQNGGGLGTFDEPRVITASPYSDADDTGLSISFYLFTYSCDGAPGMAGPEVIYRLDLADAGELTAEVLPAPGTDADVALLSDIDGDACLAWGADTLTTAVDTGTVYLAVDTPDDTDSGPFDLQVTYTASPAGDSAGPVSDAHQWVSLGTYTFDPGKDAALGSVTLEVPADLTGVTVNPPRAAADAVLWWNEDRLWHGWGEGEAGSDVAEAVLQLKEHALIGVKNAATWPVQTEPFEDSPVAFRARKGQRFMANRNFEGFYEIMIPGLAEEAGYLHEDGCFVHNRLPVTDVEEWVPPADDDDDATADDDDSAASDDDGCGCSADGAPAGSGLAAALCLALFAILRRR